MNRLSQYLMTVTAASGLLLGSLVVAGPAVAAGLSAHDARTMADGLANAYIISTRVQDQMADSERARFGTEVNRGLKIIDENLAGMVATLGDDDVLVTGIQQVRTAVAAMIQAAATDSATTTLIDEVAIELYALSINASVEESIAHLKQVRKALGWPRDEAVAQAHLKQAKMALEVARTKGAYHLENDIHEINVNLADLFAGGDRAKAVGKAHLDGRIDEVRAHMFKVGRAGS